MSTINISIPDKLKAKAEQLVKDGYYASFSDVVRASLRSIIDKNIYDIMAEEAKKEFAEGGGTTLKTAKDVDNYFDNLKRNARSKNDKKI